MFEFRPTYYVYTRLHALSPPSVARYALDLTLSFIGVATSRSSTDRPSSRIPGRVVYTKDN